MGQKRTNKNNPLSFLEKFYINYIGWRKRKYAMYKILENWEDCFSSEHEKYIFRNGMELRFEDKAVAEHIFDEIFINNCYHIPKGLDMDTIIDVGANIGFFSHYAIMKYKNAKIYSVEPDQRNYKVLNNNIRLNNYEKRIITYNNAMFSGKAKDVSFFQSKHNSGWSSLYKEEGAKDGNEITIKTISMSEFLQKNNIEKINFLKLDVEGAEYDIILNDDFISKYPINYLVVEVTKKVPKNIEHTYDDLTSYLRKHFKRVSIWKPSESSVYPVLICEQ